MSPTPQPTGIKSIELRPLIHRDQEQIALHFAFDKELKDYIKQYPGVRWPQTHKCFYLRRSEANLRGFLSHLRAQNIMADTSALSSAGETRYVPSHKLVKPATKHQVTRKREPLSHAVAEEIEVFKRFLEQQPKPLWDMLEEDKIPNFEA